MIAIITTRALLRSPIVTRVISTTLLESNPVVKRSFSRGLSYMSTEESHMHSRVDVSHTTSTSAGSQQANNDPVKLTACGTTSTTSSDKDLDDTEMEQEEMFVEAHASFEHKGLEWGGPRRGGRLLEPTRFGDWERKGRCSDF